MVNYIAFVFGYIVLALIGYITMKDVPIWDKAHYHLWIILVFSYTFFWGSILFLKFIRSAIDKYVPVWLFDWNSRIPLVLLLLASSIVSFFDFGWKIENFDISLIIDGVAIFAYLLCLCLAINTSKHIDHVQLRESNMRAAIEKIQKIANQLTIIASNVSDAEHKDLELIKNELRYLSPSPKPEAVEIENTLLKLMLEIQQDCKAGNNVVGTKLVLVKTLLAERKVIY